MGWQGGGAARCRRVARASMRGSLCACCVPAHLVEVRDWPRLVALNAHRGAGLERAQDAKHAHVVAHAQVRLHLLQLRGRGGGEVRRVGVCAAGIRVARADARGLMRARRGGGRMRQLPRSPTVRAALPPRPPTVAAGASLMYVMHSSEPVPSCSTYLMHDELSFEEVILPTSVSCRACGRAWGRSGLGVALRGVLQQATHAPSAARGRRRRTGPPCPRSPAPAGARSGCARSRSWTWRAAWGGRGRAGQGGGAPAWKGGPACCACVPAQTRPARPSTTHPLATVVATGLPGLRAACRGEGSGRG